MKACKTLFWDSLKLFNKAPTPPAGIIHEIGPILNTPLLISPGTIASTMWGLQIYSRWQHEHDDQSKQEAASYIQDVIRKSLFSGPQDGVAVIPVLGILSNRSGITEWIFGDVSYESIRGQFRADLNNPAAKAIVFDCDSPGGEVEGCFDLADEIYQARGKKPTYAVVNETALSGAYAIASAANTVYLSRTSKTGSIGVIAVHMDQSKFDARIGAKYTVIYAGARKADFNRHAPLSPEAKKKAQSMIDDAYEIFVKTVARNRGLTAQAVRVTEAGLYYGKKAIAAGLADAILPWTKALESIKKSAKLRS